jgi:acetyl-CoA C-acetyltransferase
MSIRGKAFIVGAWEHPERDLPDTTVSQIEAQVGLGALADAGLSLSDVDALYCNAPGFGVISQAEYMGLRLKVMDDTMTGGSAPIAHVGHAAAMIAAGKCQVALITLGGRPRAAAREAAQGGGALQLGGRSDAPESGFEDPYGLSIPGVYAMAARRHMHEFGTTSEQLAEIKVAAAHHAQYNPNALRREPVSVEDVVNSPMVSDPLHRLDCCQITDGGGGLVVVSEEVARDLPRRSVKILGHGEAVKHADNGRIDLTYSGARWSGPAAFAEAGVTPADMDCAMIYDSFTITVLETLEDLGFCEKGKGGRFVLDGTLQAPHGALPFNTDGGGLCNNHPGNRGGMTKVIEAVRQLRGEANAEVQVPDVQLALAHGTGGFLGSRMGSCTVILGQEDS